MAPSRPLGAGLRVGSHAVGATRGLSRSAVGCTNLQPPTGAGTPRVACRGLKGAHTVLPPFFEKKGRAARQLNITPPSGSKKHNRAGCERSEHLFNVLQKAVPKGPGGFATKPHKAVGGLATLGAAPRPSIPSCGRALSLRATFARRVGKNRRPTRVWVRLCRRPTHTEDRCRSW